MKKAIDFPGQRPDEKLILLVRRHWTRLFKDVVKFIFLAIIPAVLAIVLIFVFEFSIYTYSDLVLVITSLLVSLYYLFIMLLFLNNFIDYQLDLWVVTDQRIINMEQEGLFNRTASSQSIERVQDVTSEIKGKMATFLDYGNVYIQTAGEEQRFVFEEVPHPSKISKMIQDVHDRVEDQEEREDRESLVEAMRQGGVDPKQIMLNKNQSPKKDLSLEPPMTTKIDHQHTYTDKTLREHQKNEKKFL